MKKLLSVILTVIFIVASLGVVALAAYTSEPTTKTLSFNGYSSITVPANEADNEIELKLLLTEIPSEFNFSQLGGSVLKGVGGTITTSGVNVVADSVSFTGLDTLMSNLGEPDILTNKIYFLKQANSSPVLQSSLNDIDGVLVSFKVKRTDSSITTATVNLNEITLSGIGKTKTGSEVGQNLTINFDTTPTPTYPSYSNEETFNGSESFASSDAFKDTTIDANTKAFTVFGKASQALASGDYGIKVTANDDKVYTFKGLAPVAKDGIWAIKIVSPDGTFHFADNETTLTTKSIVTFEKDTTTNVTID